jgi:F-type H+-transporting ATPase subunit epsilon
MAFQCIVVTPDHQVLDQSITQAIVPAHDGKIGILTDRAPLLMKLGVGEMRLDLQSGQKQSFYVEGGVAQMKDNKLTILTQEATPAAQIDAAAARAELTAAQESKPTDAAGVEQRNKALARARARVEMTQKTA